MKCKTISFVLLMALLVLAGCSSSKKVAYFQNIQSVDFDKSKGLYDAKILPKDMLTITVNTQTPEAALPFNLAVSNVINPTGQLSSGAGSLQGYMCKVLPRHNARTLLSRRFLHISLRPRLLS